MTSTLGLHFRKAHRVVRNPPSRARLRSATHATGTAPELRIAGLGGRGYAFVVDWHIRVLAGLCWYAASAWVLNGDFIVSAPDPAFWLVVAAPAAAVYLLYHPVLETLTGGTPGKRIAGVRIVALDGQRPGVAALAIRNALRPIDSLVLYAVGVTCVLMSRQAVRLGDMAAGTVLIYMESNRSPCNSTSTRSE